MRLSGLGSLIVAALVLTACLPGDEIGGFKANDPYDRPQNLETSDYRQLNDPAALMPEGVKGEVATGIPPIPDVAQILAAPRPPKIGQTKLVSIAVTEDVPLRDVLFELSRLADVDVEVGGGIEGGINFRAKNKPFNQVIERISDLAGLRYKMTDGVLRIERDTPYIKNYSIDFLNLVRSSESSVSISTDVLSVDAGGEGGGDTGGGSAGNGSGSSSGGSSSISSGTSASINAAAESDLWSSLEASVQEILNSRPAGLAGLQQDAAEQTSGSSSSSSNDSPGYVINRQAGIISVSGTERQHEAVSQFLKLMERNASAQVLIEAKIVEVTLRDEFRTGVNWDAVLGNGRFGLNFQPTTSFGTNSVLSFALNESNNATLDDVVQLTQQFGTTRTLSSPRLHAINNQPAVLTFAQNRIFFEVQITGGSSTSGGGTVIANSPSFTNTRRSIPIGIILTILPSVNLKTSEVTLNVRPTLSRVVSTVQDPGSVLAAQLAGATITNDIPIVEVRELDSIMKIKSGGIMVIGGLMEDATTNQNNGVPVVSEIPWLGNAFKSRDEVGLKRELIIFIKATIVNSSGSHQPADKAIYDKFTTDPRPLKM